MKFQNRPISKTKENKIPPQAQKPAPPSQKKPSNPQKAKIITIIVGCLIIVGLGWGVVSLVKSLDLSTLVSPVGKSLHVDKNGHTNILLTGIGGKGHDGSDLTDTIIVASIDYDNKSVAMLSIPRDLWIKDKRFTSGNGSRINAIYAIGKNQQSSEERMENLKQVVSDITGVEIQYWIKVDFQGFTEIIDTLGGVNVNVEKAIYDPTYPRGETGGYETFAISAGPHILMGDEALKYARSRHEGDGDFDRARRQHQLLMAIKEKALSLNILTNPAKIQEIYSSLTNNFETDLEPTEIIELAKLAKDIGQENTISRVLTNHPNDCGGFLYQPPRSLYNNADVFLPMGGNYDYVHLFTQNFLRNPLLLNDESPIQVLNGTKTTNVAGKITTTFNRFCFNVINTANAQNRDLQESTIYYQPGPKGEKPPLLSFLTLLLPPMKIQAGIPAAYLDTDKKKGTVFVIELGADYLKNQLSDPSGS